MDSKTLRRLVMAMVAAGGAAHATTPTPTMYGTLCNFDVINDTGQETHGFEIEIDGVSPADVVYTFGEPYERYGNPTVVEKADHSGVYVRYTSGYNANSNPKWSASTPIAVPPIPATQGHECWAYGGGSYPNEPCDHFGVSLTVNPTNTIYRWLVEDPVNPGKLVYATDPTTHVPLTAHIPPPVWNVNPQNPANPPAPGNIIVQPKIAAPPGVNGNWGEPVWVKVYTKEVANQEDAELDDLVPGNGNALPLPGIDPPDNPEIEWQLLQSTPSGSFEFESENEVSESSEAVTKVYEFYKYTGARHSDNEARCSDPSPTPSTACGNIPGPDGLYGVGDLMGAQNAAVFLAQPTPASNVTGSFSIKRSGFLFNRSQQTYYQTLTLTNIGVDSVSQVSLALDNLSANATLNNGSGRTSATDPRQSQFINVTISRDPPLNPGESRSLTLKFLNPTKAGITYATRVLAGPGQP